MLRACALAGRRDSPSLAVSLRLFGRCVVAERSPLKIFASLARSPSAVAGAMIADAVMTSAAKEMANRIFLPFLVTE